jgi:hypothetical protein
MSPVEGPLAKHLREIAEGTRAVPKTKARRHHFVPSFALSKFATPQKRDGVLFQLDTKTGQPKKMTPDQSCFVEELYTQEDDTGTQDRVLEAFFSIVENYAAQALGRFLADPFELTDEDRQTIAYYLAFQYQRTPVVLEHSAKTQQAMMAIVMGLQFANAERFKAKHREIFKNEASDEEIEQLRQRTLELLKSGEIADDKPELAAFQMMLRTADIVASVIASMTWGLVEAKEDAFVTSDRALAMHDPKPKAPWSGHALQSSEEAETTFPLTPKECLVLLQTDSPIATGQADAEGVREINLRTYGWASQYIYGRTQEVVERVRKQAKDNAALVIRPRTQKPVILEWADPNDPDVGKEHVTKGWPRGVMIPDENGRPRFASYQLIDPKDAGAIEQAISAEEATQRLYAAKGGRGKRQAKRIDADDVDPT